MTATKKGQKGQNAEEDALQKAQQEILQLTEELARLKDLAARAQADLQNAKGRLEREAGELRKFALEGLVRELLPTVDNFQRAFAHLPEDLQNHEWVKGVQAVEQDLIRRLQAAGLRKIDSLGQSVDASRHEVLQTGPGDSDTVIEVFEDGYEYQGKVLRPARVKAGNGMAA